MDNNRIKKVSELAAKILINEMLELNFYQIQYSHLSLQEGVFIERERRAFKDDKEAVQVFKSALIENISKRLTFSSYLTIGKCQTYDTLIKKSFEEAGLKKKGKGFDQATKNKYVNNLLPKDTYVKIDCGNRRVELIINSVVIKTAFAVLTTPTAPTKRVVHEPYINTSLSMFS